MSVEIYTTDILLIAYVAEVVAAIGAWIGIFRFYRQDGGHESIIWRAMLLLTAMVIFGAVVTLPVALLALFGLPRVPYTGPLVILFVMLQLGTIIAYYFIFRHIRQRSVTK